MRISKYRISEAAINDLDGIWEYTFLKWSKEQADRYHNLIMNEIEFIAENISSGKSMNHIKDGYLVSYVKSHMIFFKRKEGIVEIIRILHQKMDIESNLE
ncbi:MAG: type II toxin-antitoxin system RelE/ParE family toxin [Bacteroidales bacterium]|nr:type II toxin-antitoxin system RelE/ParE family toxin [Bacteroidales bacterium]